MLEGSIPGAPIGSTNDNDCHVTRTPPPNVNKALKSRGDVTRNSK